MTMTQDLARLQELGARVKRAEHERDLAAANLKRARERSAGCRVALLDAYAERRALLADLVGHISPVDLAETLGVSVPRIYQIVREYE